MNRVFVLLAISLMLGAFAPAATQSAAPASTPTREGQYYETSDFAITLPRGWRIFDPTKDRQTLKSQLNSLSPEERGHIEEMLQQPRLLFLALQPKGAEPSVLYLTAESIGPLGLIFSLDFDYLCFLLEQFYREKAHKVLEIRCNTNLGRKRAHRFTVEFKDIRMYEYAFLHKGDEVWRLTLATTSALWESKRAVFEAIAATFRLR